jgi:hypothetical protein
MNNSHRKTIKMRRPATCPNRLASPSRCKRASASIGVISTTQLRMSTSWQKSKGKPPSRDSMTQRNKDESTCKCTGMSLSTNTSSPRAITQLSFASAWSSEMTVGKKQMDSTNFTTLGGSRGGVDSNTTPSILLACARWSIMFKVMSI